MLQPRHNDHYPLIEYPHRLRRMCNNRQHPGIGRCAHDYLMPPEAATRAFSSVTCCAILSSASPARWVNWSAGLGSTFGAPPGAAPPPSLDAPAFFNRSIKLFAAARFVSAVLSLTSVAALVRCKWLNCA